MYWVSLSQITPLDWYCIDHIWILNDLNYIHAFIAYLYDVRNNGMLSMIRSLASMLIISILVSIRVSLKQLYRQQYYLLMLTDNLSNVQTSIQNTIILLDNLRRVFSSLYNVMSFNNEWIVIRNRGNSMETITVKLIIVIWTFFIIKQ